MGRLHWVAGPYQGCVSCGWPPEAYEAFVGDEVGLDAYYARHGWQPQRTILLRPHTGQRTGGERPMRRDWQRRLQRLEQAAAALPGKGPHAGRAPWL